MAYLGWSALPTSWTPYSRSNVPRNRWKSTSNSLTILIDYVYYSYLIIKLFYCDAADLLSVGLLTVYSSVGGGWVVGGERGKFSNILKMIDLIKAATLTNNPELQKQAESKLLEYRNSNIEEFFLESAGLLANREGETPTRQAAGTLLTVSLKTKVPPYLFRPTKDTSGTKSTPLPDPPSRTSSSTPWSIGRNPFGEQLPTYLPSHLDRRSHLLHRGPQGRVARHRWKNHTKHRHRGPHRQGSLPPHSRLHLRTT